MNAIVRRGGWAVAAAMASAGWLVAAQGPPVFKATTAHVLVDVVVTDKDDRPVTDLVADDFEIRESGRLQTIADFEHVSVPLAGRPLELKSNPGPPPDTFSNAPPPHTARAAAFVLAGLQPKDIVPIKRVMTEFLRCLSPDDQVAIVYGNRSDLSQDFTHDPGKLFVAIDNLNAAMPVGLSLADWYFQMKSVLTSLSQAREARRAVIFVSYGFRIDSPPVEVTRIFELSKRLDVPIYTIDPRGLLAPELGFEAHLEDQTPEMRRGLDLANIAQQNGMRTIAENTNGLAFVNNSNLTQAVHDIVTDNGSYYLLGFYPTPDVQDTKFHAIEVKVKRPGMKVRARSGYTADKIKPAPTTPSGLVRTLEAALPGGALEVRAFAAPVTPSARGAQAVLVLDVAYPEGQPAAADQLLLTWLAIDPDARVRASGQNTVRVPKPETADQPFRFSIEDVLELPRGQLTLRVAVSSRTLGAYGTVHVPIVVPSLRGGSFETTPLLIGLDESGTGTLVTLGKPGGLSFHPTTERTFTLHDRLHVSSRVFAPAGRQATPTLALKMGEAIVRSIPVQAMPIQGLKGATQCEATVPLEGLRAGRYVLELTAQLGSRTLVRSAAFKVR